METKETTREVAPRPARSVWSLHDAIDRVFDTWTRGFDVFDLKTPRLFEGAGEALTLPRADVSEDDKAVCITAELPGLDEKNIELTLEKDRVVIRGEKKEDKEEKRKNYYRRERSFGSVYREIALPCEVMADKATAEFKKGVLTVTLPKTPEAQTQARKIPIKGE